VVLGRDRGGGGSDLVIEAVLITLFVLAGNTLLLPVVAWLERRPLGQVVTEAQNEVHVTTDAAALPAVRRHVIERLQAARFPPADIEVFERGEDAVELVAELVSTTVAPGEIEAVLQELRRHPGIRDAALESNSIE
jgi:putative Mg2+ transporter-C (MgtC) family protein